MRNRKTRLALLILLATGPILPGSVAVAGWKAGAASVEITPDGPAWMAGYASRDKPSEGIAQDLFAKSLVIRDGADQSLIIVTLDLISVPGPLRRHIERRIQERWKLLPTSLLMNCSHTHCGPEIRTTGTALEGLTDKRRAAAFEYVKHLQQRIEDCIAAAWERCEPAELAFHRARAAFAMNRRLSKNGRFVNSPNPEGRVDHDVPVLKVMAANGELRALLFGYACHNTTLSFYQMCGDYAGYAQEALESAYPGTVALFMMGCGGDQNPYPRRTLELARQHGATLATAVQAALQTPPRNLSGSLRLSFDYVDVAYAEAPRRDELLSQAKSKDRYDSRYATRLLKQLDSPEGLLETYPAPVQVVRLGNEVLLVALPGETVVDYSLRIKRENHSENGPAVWVAGYSNDVFAYIPSLRVLLEGGYEAGGAMRYMTTVVQPGPFAADIEDRLMRAVDRLIEETAN